MKGALAGFAEWTTAEDECLRDAYSAGGIALARRALPDRSDVSLYKRARRLGLSRRRRWTHADDEALRDLWDLGLRLSAISKQLNRTKATIYWRAQKLGLPLGCPDGFEHLTAAADRVGYSPCTLRRIMRWAGKKVRAALSRPTGGHWRRQIVDPVDVDEAVAAWLRTETANSAAKRLGISGDRLRARLRKVGVAISTERHARITDEQIAAANQIAQWHKRSRAARSAGGEGPEHVSAPVARVMAGLASRVGEGE